MFFEGKQVYILIIEEGKKVLANVIGWHLEPNDQQGAFEKPEKILYETGTERLPLEHNHKIQLLCDPTLFVKGGPEWGEFVPRRDDERNGRGVLIVFDDFDGNTVCGLLNSQWSAFDTCSLYEGSLLVFL